MKYQDLVYDVVRRILRGKVGTYGQVADIIQSSKWTRSDSKVQNYNAPAYALGQRTAKVKITPRAVGHALHLNLDQENIPCHRVVNSKGRVADNFAFGGWKEQKIRLLREGVIFKDKRHVDLKEHLWSGH